MDKEKSVSRRILLRIAYDGTKYHGWQLQPTFVTVEQKINEALQMLTGERIQVIGASRTDAGVHALGNVAVFDTYSRIPAEKFSYALNQRLPEDIIVQESMQVVDDFHPRHCECRKTYEYQILNRKIPLPEFRNTAHFEYGTLDLEAMRSACQYFCGEHDFASLCAAGAQVKSTVRTIYSLEILERVLREHGSEESKYLISQSNPERAEASQTVASLMEASQMVASQTEASQMVASQTEASQMKASLMDGRRMEVCMGTEEEKKVGRMLTIRVRGNGFLYNMVRIIAGTLLEVGKGHISPEEISNILNKKNRAAAGPTAPARGLKLVQIDYMENIAFGAAETGKKST